MPAGFVDLAVSWVAFDRFVGGLIERAFSGDDLVIEDTELEGHAGLFEDLGRLAELHPEVAILYLEAFDFLESALEILRDSLQAAPAGRFS